MTSPALGHYAAQGGGKKKKKAWKANEILRVASQIDGDSFKQFIALPMVCRNKTLCWLFSVSLPAAFTLSPLYFTLCLSSLCLCYLSFHSILPLFPSLSLAHTLKTHLKTQILFPAPGSYNGVLIKGIRLYMPALIVP